MTTTAVDVDSLRAMLADRVVQGDASLPVLPDSAIRMKNASASPSTNADDLAQILELDPALSARLLKMANSAMFAGRFETTTVSQAIGRLGAAMAVAVVMGAAAKEVFTSSSADYNDLLAERWKSALLASAAARQLAGKVGLKAEEVFLAALLHSSGDSVLIAETEQLAESGEFVPKPSAEVLRDVIQPISPAAGGAVLGAWQLPDPLVNAVKFQNSPDEAPEDHAALAAMVGLAGRFGREIIGQKAPDAIADELSCHPAAERFGLDRDALFELAEKTTAEAAELVGSL